MGWKSICQFYFYNRNKIYFNLSDVQYDFNLIWETIPQLKFGENVSV